MVLVNVPAILLLRSGDDYQMSQGHRNRDQHQYTEDLSNQPYGVQSDEHAGAAQQGYCRSQCFCPFVGIHQDGVLKNVQTYEIIDPHDVGIDDNSIVLTARSGRAALKNRLSILGVQLDQEKAGQSV